MSVRRLPSGKWQAVVHLSLGCACTEAEAEARVHAYEAAQKARACTSGGEPAPCPDRACTPNPAPGIACSTPAGTTGRPAGTLEELLKRHLSADTMARMKTIQTELQVDSLEEALDYLVSDNCWDYA